MSSQILKSKVNLNSNTRSDNRIKKMISQILKSKTKVPIISQILKSKTKVLNFYLKLKSESKNVFRNVKFQNGYYGIPNSLKK